MLIPESAKQQKEVSEKLGIIMPKKGERREKGEF
jgi:hypothetical protein